MLAHFGDRLQVAKLVIYANYCQAQESTIAADN